jgi:MoxR-like ATPase
MSSITAREIRDRPLENLGAVMEVAKAEIGKAVLGQEEAIELMLIAALARGHVLLEGPPGTAKTLLGSAIARILAAKFTRVQFTPDTSPTEIVGEFVMRGGEAVFERGAVFTNVLLADEINRTPPRTQAALLEAMQERHVSVRGRTYWIDPPFLVIATQNAHEHIGVFPLPESQLDRFLVKIALDYGSAENELDILSLPHRGASPDTIGEVFPLLGDRGFLIVQDAVDTIGVPAHVARALVAIVRGTRAHPGVQLGASPRGAIHLLAASKARAAILGRTEVALEDVTWLAPHVLGHRVLSDEAPGAEVVNAVVESVLRSPSAV